MASPPKINLTVLTTRAFWQGVELRKWARKAPGGGRAEPLTLNKRHDNYAAQNGPRRRYTPAQLRRRNRKLGRAMSLGISKPGEVRF